MFYPSFPSNWSTLRKMMLYKGIFGEPKPEYQTVSGPIASFVTKRAAPLRSLVANIEPVQAGSGDPSPDNVRPISGWSAVNVWRTGKNKFGCADGTYAVGSTRTITVADSVWSYKVNTPATSSVFLPEATVTAMNIPILKPGTYTFSLVSNATPSSIIAAAVLNLSGGQAITNGNSFTISADTSVVSITTPTSGEYAAGTYTCQIQIESGTTATAWSPYSGNQYNIQLSQTVYGGTLDVTNGVLTVDRYLYVYDGTEPFSKSPSALNGFYNNLVGFTPHDWPKMWNYNLPVTPISSEISSMFKMTRIADTYRKNYGYCYLDSGMNFSCDPDLFGTTVNSFKAKLAELYESGTPVSAFVKLNTPITIPLTPTEISTLQGQNNLWADSGDVTVEYRSN